MALVKLPVSSLSHTPFSKIAIVGAQTTHPQTRPIPGLATSRVQPSGTAGAAASTTPSAAAPSSSPQESPPSPSTITVQATVSQSSLNPPASPQSSSPPSISSPAPPESSTPPPTTSSPPLQASQPSWTPTPSAVVTTVLGSIQTVIITPTLPPATAQTQVTTVNGTAMPDSFWSNTGKVAGTFTVVGIVVLALIGALVWLIVRRTRTRESMAITSTDGDNGSVTQMPFGAEKRNSKLTLTTAGLSGMRREGSNGKSTSENTPASMSRRTSMPLVHDQRLDPRALYNIENANASHVSVGSFRDDRDYSRPVLHVRNPD
ncbi:hypothetical protein MMC10_007121 [Thelotrema lepadinum]|nr:hypothetical protein [Thelotrema lepadinum]